MSQSVMVAPAKDETIDSQDVPIFDSEGSTPSPSSLQASEIEYQYLTFETTLPLHPVLPPNLQKELPPCPNLKDYDNPFNWSLTRKNFMTYLSASVVITASYAAGSYASPAFVLTEKWGVSNVAYNVGITLFSLGFGVAPMVLAPFSEINGRRPVFIASGVLFVVSQLGCAVTDSYAGMLVARFFLGCGGSTFATMVGGILADIWVTADRNTPMTVFSGATLFGTGLGPLVSGVVAQRTSWRWVFWIQVFTSGISVSLVTIFFKETRGSIILSRKAKILNKWYEALEEAGALGIMVDPHDLEKAPSCRIRWKVKADEERASLRKMIAISLYRPFHMLLTESVVFWFSLWVGFCWGILYLQFGSIPLVFEVNHGFTLEQTGFVFTSMCVAAILAVLLGIYSEKWAVKHYPNKINGSPEGRLVFTCIESALMPIGIFVFGWTCYPSIHWIAPTIGVGIATIGILSIYLTTFNYTADVYGTYTSSALAGIGLVRNLLGGAFPLVTRQMFTNMGFQSASSLLGAIGAVLTLVPWVLAFYGPRIRARSKIASSFT